jgi:hypothetical protein
VETSPAGGFESLQDTANRAMALIPKAVIAGYDGIVFMLDGAKIS